MNSLLRSLLKVGAIPCSFAAPERTAGGIYLLIYHKVGGDLPLDIDMPLPLFRRQIEFLHRTGRVIAYEQALTLLQGNQLGRDLFVLTFDDGYEDFYSQVFPLLKEFKLPATLFVTSGFVEEGVTYPLIRRRLPARPVTWDMLGEMHRSGLVTIGAHTHTHPNLVEITDAQLRQELTHPLDLFQARLGFKPSHLAYPGAIWDEKVEQRVTQYYRSAVIGGGKKAIHSSFNQYRIPRLPVRTSDGWFFFQAKLRGWLAAEERLYSVFHRLRGNNGFTEN